MEVMTWQTYKKKYNPDIWSVRDSTKGWIRTIVQPTMRRIEGIKHCGKEDISSDNRKPKQIVLEDFEQELKNAKLVVYFVYHPTRSYAGYFTSLDIYYK